MDELVPIGIAAERVGVAPSTIRYYERRGLVAADARASGQRRFSAESIRRLVFIGMLQDAGMTLDDIAVVLDSGDNAAWKALGVARLAALDAEITRLQRARDYLEGTLLCRYDHPATECWFMGEEIDRRLGIVPDDDPGPDPAVATKR